ncbi:MAG: branched-chain amino acid ABC transporter substrate-binding protein, partial [Candidatus Adiutrix sp.]
QARVAAAVLADMGYKNIAILHDNSAYGKGLATEARGFIEGAGTLNIVFFDALQPRERDFTTILTKLKGVNPDAIFFTGYYPEAGILLRQMAEMRWSVPMLGGDAANNIDLVKIAGVEAAKGYRFVSPPMPSDLQSTAAKEFLTAYRAKYNEEPSSIWSVVAGDAFKVAVEAIKARGIEAGAIADYLHNELKDFEGLTGKILFDQKGDRVGDVYRLYEVDAEGRFILK